MLTYWPVGDRGAEGSNEAAALRSGVRMHGATLVFCACQRQRPSAPRRRQGFSSECVSSSALPNFPPRKAMSTTDSRMSFISSDGSGLRSGKDLALPDGQDLFLRFQWGNSKTQHWFSFYRSLAMPPDFCTNPRTISKVLYC